MNENISWGKVVVLVVAIVGVGALGFVVGRQKSEVAVVAPIAPTVQSAKKEEATPIEETSSNTSIPADWKTYTNNSLGFSIKYPSNWKIDSARSDRNMSGSDVVFNVGIPESHEGITVNTSNVSSLDEWAEQAQKNLVLDGAYQGTSYLTVDGQPAVRIDTTELGGKIVAVLFNGKLYRFDTQGQMIENGMLSTFRFTR